MKNLLTLALLLSVSGFLQASAGGNFLALQEAHLSPRSSAIRMADSWSDSSGIQAFKVHQNLKLASKAAANEPDKMLELWQKQQAFNKASGRVATDSDEKIYAWDVHQSLKLASKAAANDPDKMLELWQKQQAFNKDSERIATESDEKIYAWDVHRSLKSASKAAANDPDKMLKLWQKQQVFNKDSERVATDSDEKIYAWDVHQSFYLALGGETSAFKIVSLYESWQVFIVQSPVGMYDRERPEVFKEKYLKAKEEAAKSQSLVLSTSSVSARGAAAYSYSSSSGVITVASLVYAHGMSNLNTGSLKP